MEVKAILDGVVKEDPYEKVTSDMRFEWWEGLNHAKTCSQFAGRMTDGDVSANAWGENAFLFETQREGGEAWTTVKGRWSGKRWG